jgi:hypothetical protein
MVTKHFLQNFNFKTLFDFSKMDKNKCPNSKSQKYFWKKKQGFLFFSFHFTKKITIYQFAPLLRRLLLFYCRKHHLH